MSSRKKGSVTAKNRRRRKEKQYEIDMILDHKMKDKKRWYFVHWKGYPDSDNSWVHQDDMDSQFLIDQYFHQLVVKEKQAKRDRKTATRDGTPHNELASEKEDTPRHSRELEPMDRWKYRTPWNPVMAEPIERSVSPVCQPPPDYGNAFSCPDCYLTFPTASEQAVHSASHQLQLPQHSMAKVEPPVPVTQPRFLMPLNMYDKTEEKQSTSSCSKVGTGIRKYSLKPPPLPFKRKRVVTPVESVESEVKPTVSASLKEEPLESANSSCSQDRVSWCSRSGSNSRHLEPLDDEIKITLKEEHFPESPPTSSTHIPPVAPLFHGFSRGLKGEKIMSLVRRNDVNYALVQFRNSRTIEPISTTVVKKYDPLMLISKYEEMYFAKKR